MVHVHVCLQPEHQSMSYVHIPTLIVVRNMRDLQITQSRRQNINEGSLALAYELRS